MGKIDIRQNIKKLKRPGINVILQMYLYLITQGAVFFIAAGHTSLPRVWYYLSLSIIYSTVSSISSVVIIRLNPESISQGEQRREGVKSWDKLFIKLALPLILMVPLISGLDIGRFGWSRGMNIQCLIIGTIIYVAANMFSQWAIVVNPHFETTAHIQKEGNRQVISAGPYKIVRHPVYLGIILGQISVPMITGSLFALIPAVAVAFLVIMRAGLEDKMLRDELPGYAEYARRVKYQLFFGIW